MKAFLLCVAACLAVPIAPAQTPVQTPVQSPQQPLHSSTQLLVVTTANWNAVPGMLQRYERTSTGKRWKAVGAPITVVVGESGLGWGVGLMPQGSAPANAPIKKEGDGKAPAGIFALTSTFGYADHAPASWKMPYIALTPTVECVDDIHSRFYNQIVDRSKVANSGGTVDWNSSEQMRRPDVLYTWGAFIAHNSGPATPGDGSCIFLHIWRQAGTGTVGCTAMPQPQVESILGWLDPQKKPLLVQMPIAQYKAFQKRWKFPRLPRALRKQ